MKKKIILLVSILMLTLTIGMTASADSVFVGGYEENYYPFYNLTNVKYNMGSHGGITLNYDVEMPYINDTIFIDGNYTTPISSGDEYPLSIVYSNEEYNECYNLLSTYNISDGLPILPNIITLTYKYFVLKDYFLEEDHYSSLERTSIFLDSTSYFNIDSVNVTCYVLEYKFINDEWQIVPVLYDFNVNTYINQETQQEGINFALIYDELQNYNSREEYAIRDMHISFNLSYNDASIGVPIVITNMGYGYYDYPITDILTSLNKQVWLEPIEYDYTNWIVNATKGFLDAEILPGFKISGILGICLTISLLMYILKLFLGG